MRLFVAVFPPTPARADLRRALRQQERELDGAALRLTPVERWHLTLAFLGEVADEHRGAVEMALDGVPGARRRPVEAVGGRGIGLWLAGAGRFENGGSAALWTGVAGDLTGLSGLQTDICAALVAAGLPVDHRSFRPHLTIAYSRGGRAPAALDDYAGPAWTVDEFVLVRSRFHEGGGYDHLGAWAC